MSGKVVASDDKEKENRGSRWWRDVWPWMIPALVAGVVVRAVLMWEVPYAFIHVDTIDVLSTAERIAEGKMVAIDGKKTFLVPVLYALIAQLPLNALPVIAFVQHIAGLCLVVLGGFLCRLLFDQWRVWTVLFTSIMSLHPAFLWYEHCAMPECWAVLGMVASAFGILWYLREPRKKSVVAAAGGLLLLAASRPEGQLLWPAMPLAILWVNRNAAGRWVKAGAAVAAGVVVMLLTKTGQSGMLLLSSLLVFAPDEFWSEPEIGQRIAAVREKAAETTEFFPERLVQTRRHLRREIMEYLQERGLTKIEAGREAEHVAFRLGAEIAARNAHKLPGWAIYRVWATAAEPMADGFYQEILIQDQVRALRMWESRGKSLPLMTRMLFGDELEDAESLEPVLREKMRGNSEGVFAAWHDNFKRMARAGVVGKIVGETQDLPHFPILWMVAILGLAGAFFDKNIRPFAMTFGISLVVLFFIVFIAANVRARFRLLFEPMWWVWALVGVNVSINWMLLFVKNVLPSVLRPLRNSGAS